MPATLRILTDTRCNSGTVLAEVNAIERGMIRQRVDNDDNGTFTGFEDDPWVSDLALRRVVEVTDALGEVSEWRIGGIRDSEEGDGRVTVALESLILDLDGVPVLKTTTGGETLATFDVPQITLQAFWDGYIQPALDDAGYTWIVDGTIEPTGTIDMIRVNGWSVMRAVQELATLTRTEIDWVRNGTTNYQVGFVTQRGSGGANVELMPGKQIISLERDREFREAVSAATPLGLNGATLGQNAWRVAAVGGSTVDLEDAAGGRDPIAFDDQLNTLWLLKTDGSRSQITDSTVTNQRLTVDPTNVTVGDLVQVCKDSSGTHLSTLTNPAVAASPGSGGFDYVHRFYVDESLRGERNYIPDPFFRGWTDRPATDIGEVASGTSGTTLNLQNLTPGFVLAAGDLVFFTPGSNTVRQPRRITSGDTADGSGNASVTLSSNTVSTAAGTAVWLIQASKLPPGYGAGPDNFLPAFAYPTGGDGSTLTAKVNGAVAANGRTVVLDNMTNGDVVSLGDTLFDGGSNRWMIWKGGTVSGGTVTVTLFGTTTGGFADNADVSIERAAVDASYGEWAFCTPMSTAGGGSDYFTATSFTLPYRTDIPKHQEPGFSEVFTGVFATAGCSFFARQNTTLLSDGADPLGPILRPRDDGDSYNLNGGYIGEGDLALTAGPATVDRDLTSRGSITFTATDTFEPRLVVPLAVSDTVNCKVLVFWRWISVHVGAERQIPVPDPSHANALWHLANSRLTQYARVPARYSLEIENTAAVPGYVVANETITLGAVCTLKGGRMNLNDELRVLEKSTDLVDDRAIGLVVDTLYKEQTRQFAELARLLSSRRD